MDKIIVTDTEAMSKMLDRTSHRLHITWLDILEDIDDMTILKEASLFCRQRAERNPLNYAIWHPRKVRVDRLIDQKLKRISNSETGVE